MHYFFLILGLVSLGGLGVLHKCADSLDCRPSAVNLFLFAWATLAAAAILLAGTGVVRALSVPPYVVLVGGLCGSISSVAILALQQALRYGEISTSWLIINLSTAIPTALSIVIYKEKVGFRQYASLALAVLALLLLWRDQRNAEARVKDDIDPVRRVAQGRHGT